MKTFLLFLAIFPLNGFCRTPEERRQLFESATKKLKASGIEQGVPKPGDLFPDISLDGKTISELVRQGPLIVTFYRGGWCPYCVKQLKELNQGLKEMTESNAQLIAISPEKPSEVRKTKSRNNLDFTLISDANNELARKVGLVFKVDEGVVKEYKALGISLAESQGNSRNELPIPGTFVINYERKVTYSFADADYTKRADIKDILKEVKSLKK